MRPAIVRSNALSCRCPVHRLPSSGYECFRRFGTTVDDVSRERPDFGGMTVNERLFTAGLLEQFDAAIDAGDRQRAMELLEQVAMSEDGTTPTWLAKPSPMRSLIE